MRLPAADAAAARHAHRDGREEFPRAAVTQARKLAHDLVVSGIDIVRELNLRDRTQAVDPHAYGRGDDSAFGDRGIEHALSAVFLLQAFGDAEHAAEIA